jgi:Arc/MetJ-type ribon-helix-helix transcriptional regulator
LAFVGVRRSSDVSANEFVHTGDMVERVAVSLDSQVLRNLDKWVAEGKYASRSKALQAALDLLTKQEEKQARLAFELAKLDPAEERSMADEGLADV